MGMAAEQHLVLVEDAIGKENHCKSQRTGLWSSLCHCVVVHGRPWLSH